MKKTYKGYIELSSDNRLMATKDCKTKTVAIQKLKYIARKDPQITWIGVYLVVDGDVTNLVYEEKV